MQPLSLLHSHLLCSRRWPVAYKPTRYTWLLGHSSVSRLEAFVPFLTLCQVLSHIPTIIPCIAITLKSLCTPDPRHSPKELFEVLAHRKTWLKNPNWAHYADEEGGSFSFPITSVLRKAVTIPSWSTSGSARTNLCSDLCSITDMCNIDPCSWGVLSRTLEMIKIRGVLVMMSGYLRGNL